MRRLFLRLVCLSTLALGACAPELAVVPPNGMDRVVAQLNGITLVAFANQWDGYPYDLTDYVTPIAVELYNPGPTEIRVSYADLALRDQSGFRFAAINPFLPATLGANDTPLLAPLAEAPADDASPVLLAANGPVLLASAHFGGGGGVHAAPAARMGGAGPRMVAPPPPAGGGRMIGPPPAGGFGGPGRPILAPQGVHGGLWMGGGRHWGYGGRAWNGYLVVGGLRPYYGFGVGYWGGPWFYPPYYNDWVFAWGPAYYPSRPSTDVLTLGLPEGVLPPGARVSGFLYFKRATGSRNGSLDLSWDAHDARTGAPLGSIHVPLAVVPR
jgi:hypothetical protein